MVKGFKMHLYEGMAQEYEKRHNQLWPEMKEMIHEHGGKNGGILWQILWKQIQITVRFPKTWIACSIWINGDLP